MDKINNNQELEKTVLRDNAKSICPTCYREIPAEISEEDGKIFMSKECPEHGSFKFLVDKDSDVYKRLMCNDCLKFRRPYYALMINVTHACNLKCPVCYLADRDTPDMSLQEIKDTITCFTGVQIRLSGGEPTVRPDLPEIIKHICDLGKDPVLITNGLKFADRKYVRELKEAGLRIIHFSFNGFSDDIYKKINGAPLLDVKLKALRNLKKEKMSVRPSILLVKGVNEQELGKLYRYSLRNTGFISAIRIRTEVAVGRYDRELDQLYLSELIDLASEAIGISRDVMFDHTLSLPRGHLPCGCGITVNVMDMLLMGTDYKYSRNPLKKLMIILNLYPKLGLKCTLNVMLKAIAGKKELLNMWLFIRVWPDKRSMDLDEFKRCHSAFLDNNIKAIMPYCYGLTMQGKDCSG
ncbi:MAG: radical SAM protein [Elusimicrobiota bacterium]